MYYVVLIVTVANLAVMLLFFTDRRNADKGKPPMKSVFAYLAQVLFGSVGAVFCIVMLGYRGADKKFVIYSCVMCAVQIAIYVVAYLWYEGVIKFA